MSQIAALINRLTSAPYSLSQSEIFRRTEIPQPRLSRWASGYVPTGADDVLKLITLAKELGVPESELPSGIVLPVKTTEAAPPGAVVAGAEA